MLKKHHLDLVLLLISSLLLLACSGGSSSGSASTAIDTSAPATATSAPATAATIGLSLTPSKGITLDWSDATDATFYRLLENPDGSSGFSQVGTDIPQGTQEVTTVVPLFARVNASYILQTCNAIGCVDSATVSVADNLVDAIGYFKASNTDGSDQFGHSVSLSADGNSLAVGAIAEGGAVTGVSTGAGDTLNSDTGTDAGAVYVFTRDVTGTDTTWSQQAYIKASNTNKEDKFGYSVSLSADGNTLAVGAIDEDGADTGVSTGVGDAVDGSANSGAVYVFTRSGTTWSQQAYIKASNTGSGDQFGHSVSLSADGNTIAVGAIDEDGADTGVSTGVGDAVDGSANSGVVYVFTRSGTTWSQQAYIKASNTGSGDQFGHSVSLSADGNTLAVGAVAEDGADTGVSAGAGDTLNGLSDAGAIYVFTRSGATWLQQAYIKASNTGGSDQFGHSVSLSADGNTLPVGAIAEAGAGTGVAGVPDNADGAPDAGSVYVY